MAMKIEDMIIKAQALGGTDVHLVTGVPPKFRVGGMLENLCEEPLTMRDCEEYAQELAGDRYHEIRLTGEMDFADTIAGNRVRINLFRQQGAVSAALRILHDHIPSIDELGLPPIVKKFPTWRKGIVLVTGETGSGKSTTLAAILDEINHTCREHIITLEDPIEYVYKPDLCLVNQREIGRDTASYETGLRAILREDPDVILIGEMRDAGTMETAMTAAETGHLVFATLHTNSAADTVDRIVSSFPADRHSQIRMQLSMTLRAVVAQQLVVKKDETGRVCAAEVMMMTPAIRNLIREGKTPQITSAILSSAREGSVTMDNSLLQMVREGKITPDTAIAAAADPERIRSSVGRANGFSSYPLK